METNPAALNYATFALELLAFVAKEAFPDSPDEFAESLIGSRLSHSMPEQRSGFGKHCLTVVTHLRAAVPYLSARGTDLAAGSASPPNDLARAAGAPTLRRMWSAVENGLQDERRDVSLDFKLGVNKVGVGLTFHW